MVFSIVASPICVLTNSVKKVKNGTDKPICKAGIETMM